MTARLSDEEARRTLAALEAAGGSRVKAARALGLNVTTLKTRLNRLAKQGVAIPPSGSPNAPDSPERKQASALGRLAQLLERSGIDPDEIGRVEKIKINEWDGFSKDEAGNPVVTRLQGESIVLAPKWADGPAWPVIAQAPAVVVPATWTCGVREDGWRTAVVYPDVQIGYFHRDGDLIPTHDEAALSVALQVTRDADPDVIVMVGDNLDFPELGRYRKHPPFQRTTQASINRAATLCAELRSVVRPECRIVWLAGNHEERLPNYIIDNASAAFGLKRANTPKSWPVLSVPHLCRFDDFDVTFLPGYPANVYWINDSLQVIHGSKVRSGGSSAHAYLPEIRHSVIFGHVHRHEFATVTRLTKDGPRTYHAACFGALCRIDGAVPGFESGYDLDGVPLSTVNNWGQGMGVVSFQPGDGDFAMEAVEIWNGRARWRGKSYHATDSTEAA